MTVELRPLGVTCNISCQYCYQNPQRDAGNHGRRYDLDAMKAAILKEGGPFSLFGGEPLLVPEKDLASLWAWGLSQFGSNGIQTNGTLISENHVRMFKKYNVHVGISIDGPGELNDIRWAGNIERTRIATAKSERAIERLCERGSPPSLIITLHRGNAVGERLTTLHAWVEKMERLGVSSARLHLLESESPDIRERFALSAEENIHALSSFSSLGLKTLRLDVFDDIKRLLLGDDQNTTCVWNACDPYTTRAVQGVEGYGQRSNCGRTNKDGIDFRKADTTGYERYLALYHTPEEFGGCAGCRFFVVCKGQCPGTAIDGDWRNRTEHCEVWKALFAKGEADMIEGGVLPVSVHPFRRLIEKMFIDRWSCGQNTGIADIIRELSRAMVEGRNSRVPETHWDAHGDHYGMQSSE